MAAPARLAVRQLLRMAPQEASQATRTFKTNATPRAPHYVSSLPPRLGESVKSLRGTALMMSVWGGHAATGSAWQRLMGLGFRSKSDEDVKGANRQTSSPLLAAARFQTQASVPGGAAVARWAVQDTQRNRCALRASRRARAPRRCCCAAAAAADRSMPYSHHHHHHTPPLQSHTQDWEHGPNYLNFQDMPGRKGKVVAWIAGMWTLGVGIPVFAVWYQQNKLKG